MDVGGHSYINGIEFRSIKYRTFFKSYSNETKIFLRRNESQKKTSILDKLNNIPIIRTLVILYRNTRFIIFIFFALLINDIFLYKKASRELLLINVAYQTLMIILLLSILALLGSVSKRIRILFQYHGAEHKVITAYKNENNVTLENARKQLRISSNCGTMVVVLFFIIIICIKLILALLGVSVWSCITFLISYVIALELFLCDENTPIIRYVFKLGFWLQEKCFTKEPTELQLTQAVATFNLLHLIELGNVQEEAIEELIKKGIVIDDSEYKVL